MPVFVKTYIGPVQYSQITGISTTHFETQLPQLLDVHFPGGPGLWKQQLVLDRKEQHDKAVSPEPWVVKVFKIVLTIEHVEGRQQLKGVPRGFWRTELRLAAFACYLLSQPTSPTTARRGQRLFLMSKVIDCPFVF